MTQAQDQKPTPRIAMPPTFTLKMLMVCVTVALYLLFAAFISLVFAGTHCDFLSLVDNETITVLAFVVLIMVFVFISLSVLHVMLALIAGPKVNKRYQQFYQKVGIVVLFLMFISLGVLFTAVTVNISSARFIAGLLMFFAGLLSFAPMLSAWQIYDEERLKLFMDAMSRVCTMLTFVGGICIVLFNALL